MNIRKPTDYTAMFTTLDTLMAAQLPQMELYCEIGRVVSGRSEKGAAVAASEHLQATYPAAEGFSPRNLRRMRNFFRMYGDTPELLAAAMRLNWTQNVVTMEAKLTMDERCWYIWKVAESGLSKTELLRMIERAEHSEIALGENEDTCYTVDEDGTVIITNDEQNNFSFMVTLAANATTKNLSLTVTPNVPSNADSLNYRRFLKKAISAKHVELKSLDQNAVFISSKANLVPHGCEKLDVEIEFLEKIVAIETHYHITLTIPDEIDISDHQIIDRLYSMLRDGKYSGICSGFTMSFNLTEELRQSIRTIGEVACSFSCSLGMHVELFDQKLDFNIIRKIDSMRLDNFEKITKKIDALDNGDPIKVSFVSGNTDPNIHYSDMFYSEETAKNLLKETVS